MGRKCANLDDPFVDFWPHPAWLEVHFAQNQGLITLDDSSKFQVYFGRENASFFEIISKQMQEILTRSS